MARFNFTFIINFPSVFFLFPFKNLLLGPIRLEKRARSFTATYEFLEAGKLVWLIET